ncbi:hypothetical protein F4779DRAFT_621496 [Xylariaceae sp. FL0662B]|nr:hypothetical protein F4779DRAFT_621496 [Xylariaceae sp. FL0662B]
MEALDIALVICFVSATISLLWASYMFYVFFKDRRQKKKEAEREAQASLEAGKIGPITKRKSPILAQAGTATPASIQTPKQTKGKESPAKKDVGTDAQSFTTMPVKVMTMDHVLELIDNAGASELRGLLAKLCHEHNEIKQHVLEHLGPASATTDPCLFRAGPSRNPSPGSSQSRLLPSSQSEPSFAPSSRSAFSASMSRSDRPSVVTSPPSPRTPAGSGTRRRRPEAEDEDEKQAKRVQKAFYRCNLDRWKPADQVRKVQGNIDQLQERITLDTFELDHVEEKSRRREMEKMIERMTSSLDTQRQLLWNLLNGL